METREMTANLLANKSIDPPQMGEQSPSSPARQDDEGGSSQQKLEPDVAWCAQIGGGSPVLNQKAYADGGSQGLEQMGNLSSQMKGWNN